MNHELLYIMLQIQIMKQVWYSTLLEQDEMTYSPINKWPMTGV
jgi:hypothetical protein